MNMVGRRLMDEDSTSTISSGESIYLKLRLCGGATCGMPFADVTDEAGPAMLEWSTTGAPDWRTGGSWLELGGKVHQQAL